MEEVRGLAKPLPRSSTRCCVNAGSSFLKMPSWLADQECKTGAVAKLKNTAPRVCALATVHGKVAQRSY